MRWIECATLILSLSWGSTLTGCVGAARPESGVVSPADRAVPEPASGHATDGPTATRTSAQRPVEEQPAPEGEEGAPPGEEPPGLWD